SSHKLLGGYNKLSVEQYKNLAAARLELIESLVKTINKQLNAKIIYYNYTEINDSIFGNYATKIESSFLFQLRKLNYQLMLFATEHSNFYLCDISSIQNHFGKSSISQPSLYINSEMILSLDILPDVAIKTLAIIEAIYGKIKKCLVLDLDNTLWGGIIG